MAGKDDKANDKAANQAKAFEDAKKSLKSLHEEYLSILEKEITKAFVTAYDEQAESLFNNYLDQMTRILSEVNIVHEDQLQEGE